MKRNHFRAVLVVYFIVFVFEGIAFFGTRETIPLVVQELERAAVVDNRILTTVFSSLFLGSFGLAIIGVVGMLFFWSPSRYLFLVSLIIRTLVMSLHYKWICITNLHGFFVAAENFLEGAIMALCLVGPAKNLFKKKRH